MKRILLFSLMLVGCNENNIKSRQAIVEKMGTTNVHQQGYKWIARDVDKNIWVIETNCDNKIESATKIFEGDGKKNAE